MGARISSILVAVWALALGACSPALNWRELALDEGRLHAAFPCKPDRAQREQGLGGQPLVLHMAGCEAAGALFVVAYLEVPPQASGERLQAHWRQQVLQRLQSGAWDEEQAARVKGAADGPVAVRGRARGVDASGHPLALEALWFARAGRLYHAAIYAPQLTAAMRDPFFGALELR